MRRILSILALILLSTSLISADESTAQQIRNVLNAYHLAEMEVDLNGILNAYAEDFEDPLGATKPMLVEIFKVLLSQGLLNNLEVNMSEIIISVDELKADAGPVTYTTALGTDTYSYELRKDADGSCLTPNAKNPAIVGNNTIAST